MSDEGNDKKPELLNMLGNLDKHFYRIGEVSDLTGIKPHVLRYWESEFPVLTPPKSRSQQRLYRREDIETILLLKKLLYEDGYTIAGARSKLKSDPATWPLVAAASEEGEKLEISDASSDEMKATLLHVRRELHAIRDMLDAQAAANQPPSGHA